MDRNRFQERTTIDKSRNYNHCYTCTYDDGEEFIEENIKEECAECSLCKWDDLFFECVCMSKRLCEHG